MELFLLPLYFSLIVGISGVVEVDSIQIQCELTECDHGNCLFENCANPTSCGGGLCRFVNCVQPECMGGACTFEKCSHPSCHGGGCHMIEVKTTLTDGYCQGGSCRVDGKEWPSTFSNDLSM